LLVAGWDGHPDRGIEGGDHAPGVDPEVDRADVGVDPLAHPVQAGRVLESAERGGGSGSDRDQRGRGGGPEEQGATRGRGRGGGSGDAGHGTSGGEGSTVTDCTMTPRSTTSQDPQVRRRVCGTGRPVLGIRRRGRDGRPTGIRVPPTPPAGPADWHPGPAHSAGRAGRLASGSRRLRLGGRAVVGAVVLWCRSAATSAPDLKRGSLAIEGTLDSTIVQIT